MQLSDLIVEVRDVNLNRLGMVSGSDLDISISPLHNERGSWTLKLASEHPLHESMLTPGSGIIVSDARTNNVLLSGPTTSPESNVSAADLGGTTTFTGISDNVILWDRLAYPQPANANVATQNVDYYTITDEAESVLHAVVNANLGPSAPTSRKIATLTMGTDSARGASVKKSLRFDVVGDVLAGVAAADNLGFRVTQQGTGLIFETYAVYDRTKDIRLDVRNGTVNGHKVATSAPTATHVITGQAEVNYDRLFALVTTDDSDAASTLWGRRIERFVDQQQTLDPVESTQSAKELLAAEGIAQVAVQALPSDDTDMTFGIDYFLGDKVSIVVDDQEVVSVVTGFTLIANSEGIKVGIILGDATGFDYTAKVASAVTAVTQRVSALERVATQVDDTGWVNLTLSGAWVNYTAGYGNAQYRRIGDEVHLRGMVKDGAADSTIATLPNDLWPPIQMPFAVATQARPAITTGAASAGTAHTHSVSVSGVAGRLDVTANGQIATTGAASGWVSLNGVSFLRT